MQSNPGSVKEQSLLLISFIMFLRSMLKLLDVLIQLDHLKNAKASIPNDFSWYKRYDDLEKVGFSNISVWCSNSCFDISSISLWRLNFFFKYLHEDISLCFSRVLSCPSLARMYNFLQQKREIGYDLVKRWIEQLKNCSTMLHVNHLYLTAALRVVSGDKLMPSSVKHLSPSFIETK